MDKADKEYILGLISKNKIECYEPSNKKITKYWLNASHSDLQISITFTRPCCYNLSVGTGNIVDQMVDVGSDNETGKAIREIYTAFKEKYDAVHSNKNEHGTVKQKQECNLLNTFHNLRKKINSHFATQKTERKK